MKVMYVTEALPFGPGEAFFIPEINGLINAGHQIKVCPVWGTGSVVHADAQGLLANTLRARFLSRQIMYSALCVILTAPWSSLRAFLVIVCNSRNLRVLAKNLASFPKGLWVARRARSMGIEHLHACWTTWPASVAMVASLVSGIPWSMSAHSGEILDNWLLGYKLRHARFVRFIAYSWLQVAIRAQRIPYPDPRLSVLHLGVDLPANTVAPATDARVLICPAALDPVKGHRFLLEAAACLKASGVSFQLWLVGDGPERRSLEQRAADLGVANETRFFGQLSHDELLTMYLAPEVAGVVLPSLREGIPVALMEAMAYAKPVVASVAGGIPELLWGDVGLLVPPMDVEHLADALRKILCNPDLRHHLGERARARVEAQFSIQGAVQGMIDRFVNYGLQGGL